MRHLLLLCVASALAAQQAPPVRILHGELLEWEVKPGSGEFSLRAANHHVERCRVTPDTFITRQTHRIGPTAVRPGDTLEVIADMRLGEARCLAVTIYVRPPDLTRRYARLTLPLPLPRNFMDNLLPRGNLTFAGIVQRLERDRMVLRTRASGHQSFLLRPDTIYAQGGREVEAKVLELRTQVFVRAGRGFLGEMEAYSITWGEIVNPRY